VQWGRYLRCRDGPLDCGALVTWPLSLSEFSSSVFAADGSGSDETVEPVDEAARELGNI
jgi:hypothetical protein